jgi:epsilon-lactone hydrolase
MTMPSPQSQAVKDLYRSWTAARTTQPERTPEDERDDTEHWGDLTAEPGGVDYIETSAGGVPAMWLVPKGATRIT